MVWSVERLNLGPHSQQRLRLQPPEGPFTFAVLNPLGREERDERRDRGQNASKNNCCQHCNSFQYGMNMMVLPANFASWRCPFALDEELTFFHWNDRFIKTLSLRF